MRFSLPPVVALTLMMWSVSGATTRAAGWKSGGKAMPPRQSVSAAPGQEMREHITQESIAQERQVLGQVRGYQLQLDREAKLLAQRMAYAAKLRANGLKQKDQRLLDQAERYERQAFTVYRQRVQQLEGMQFRSANRKQAGQTPTGSRSRRVTTPRTRTQTPRYRTQRSSRRPAPKRPWYRFGWR